MWVIEGAVFDVAVDIRRDPRPLGSGWSQLTADNKGNYGCPPIAHGFVVSDFAQVLYKTTEFYSPAHERRLSGMMRRLHKLADLASYLVLKGRESAHVGFRRDS